MSTGDIKTFTISYSGLVLEINAIDLGDGTTRFEVKCIEGFADINALYWNDGDTTGGEGTLEGFLGTRSENSLNMNGSGEAWDGGYKLSNVGLGSDGVTKATYLTKDETLVFTAQVDWSTLDTLGVRATSTSTAEGSIKGVADEPIVTECPEISINDVTVKEGVDAHAAFTISLDEPYPYPITITYSTGDGTASAPGDYSSATLQTVVIPANQTSVEVKIAITDDMTFEPTEQFYVNIISAEADIPGDDLNIDDCIKDEQGIGTILDNDTDTPPPPSNDFPEWEQDISNVILVFDQETGDTKPAPGGDGYYTVKIDEWPGPADDDLDNSIDDILDYVIATDPNVTEDSDLLGVIIKGGTEDTNFYAYGDNNTNGTDPDTPPDGLGLSWEGDANPQPASAVDMSYDYDDVFATT